MSTLAAIERAEQHLKDLVLPQLRAFAAAWKDAPAYRNDPESLRFALTDHLRALGQQVLDELS